MLTRQSDPIAPTCITSRSPWFVMAAVACCTGAALAQSDVVSVTGLVRDFHKTDPIINTAPATGNGHYAGNVASTLNASWLPTYTASGYKVSTQWRDQSAHNIPPHLASSSQSLQLASAPTYNPTKAYMDTWDSAAGSYGGANVGPAPALVYPAAMPSIAPPTGLNSVAAVVYGANVNATISTSYQTPSFTTGQGCTITINGNVTIYCTGNFTLAKNNKIVMAANSSLNLYVGGLFKISQTSTVNMINPTTTGTPSKMKLYALSSLTPGINLNQGTKFCGQVWAPNCTMQLDQNDHFYGSFWGKSINMDQGCGFHFDGMPEVVCGAALNDTAGAAGATSGGGITSAADFLKWFSDVPGTNASRAYTIDLVRNASGIYEYLNDAFLPIDHQIYGNEGQAHNYYFTYVVDLFFAHDACASPAKFVEFRGADDCWIFVNDDLGIDLGGMVPLTKQRLDVDRLNLNDGQVYALRIFYAQRNSSVAQFHLWTNLDLLGSAEPSMVTSAFD